jgi:pimeloyl-ACP methyl ester carboxylesterase
MTNSPLLKLVVVISLLLPVLVSAAPARAPAEDPWTVLAFDPKGDGRNPSMPDAALFSYRYDRQQDLLWFRITLYDKPNPESFGVNIAVNTGEDEAGGMNWWGANKDFKFNKLITAWVTHGEKGYQGTIGIADAAGANSTNFTNLRHDNLQVLAQNDSILIGVKRADLTGKMKMELIAAVGSNTEWNDDVPNIRSATLDLAAPRPVRGLRELDLDRNNFHFPSGYKTLAETHPPSVVRNGSGRRALILVPGAYSGREVFDSFMARTASQYRFYLLTPAGLNGTPARPLPPETTSYGEFTWTRQLERDILELIRKEKLQKPVIVVHGFPGSLAAEELATDHPDVFSGIIEIASMPIQFAPSFKEPGKLKPAAPDERIQIFNDSWAKKWFKYVTPETWESNNYQSGMFANDPERAERARQQVEAAPLPVKIRYLSEYMASDHAREFAALRVPLLVLRPGFTEQYLADPANSFYKTSFQDAWNAFAANPKIQLLIIPGARALVLDDQPGLADDAIARFVQRLSVYPVGDGNKAEQAVAH